ncbi:MAG: phosphotransferase [Verrucomicrobiota bacterium]
MNHHLAPDFRSLILEKTGASEVEVEAVIQELWSGYGHILRLALQGGQFTSLIAKHVRIPGEKKHPRGWTTDLSHQRKVRSYEVESEWYRRWNAKLDAQCRIPGFIASACEDDSVFLLLEDLDAAGFPLRKSVVGEREIEHCLDWLAEFHAIFLGMEPEGLWKTGTYWHLETRPDELAALEDFALRSAAPEIDRKLSAAKYQTFVHGDAKLANFCFADKSDRVAAVDFQYVGGGCGIKDVAYFMGSCLDESACEARETLILDYYFNRLGKAIKRRQPDQDVKAVEEEWRELFPLAWADFHRFLKGWCPGHWKINSYSEQVVRKVLQSL